MTTQTTKQFLTDMDTVSEKKVFELAGISLKNIKNGYAGVFGFRKSGDTLIARVNFEDNEDLDKLVPESMQITQLSRKEYENGGVQEDFNSVPLSASVTIPFDIVTNTCVDITDAVLFVEGWSNLPSGKIAESNFFTL